MVTSSSPPLPPFVTSLISILRLWLSLSLPPEMSFRIFLFSFFFSSEAHAATAHGGGEKSISFL